MKFFTALTALLVSSVAALPSPSRTIDGRAVFKRDVSAITSGVASISANIKTLNDSINSFNPTSLLTLPQLLTILTDTDNVGDSIITTTKAVNNTAPLDDTDSLTVGVAFLNLEPQIPSLLNNLVAAAPRFDSVVGAFSARKTVLQALQLEAELARELGNAVDAKISSELLGVAQNVNAEIASAFANAIAVYSKPSTKGLELPAIPSRVIAGKVVNI